MSHFECRLNRHFWRKKNCASCPNWRRGSGGEVIWTKSKRKATFFRETFPNPRPTQVRHGGPGAGRDQAEKRKMMQRDHFFGFVCLFVFLWQITRKDMPR